jgi:hypothetical protein
MERELRDDFRTVGERFGHDEKFCFEVYRALADNRWTKDTGAVVSLTWSEAEAFVNNLRDEQERPPLALQASGGEGEVSDDVRAVLLPRGWAWQPLALVRRDPAHQHAPEAPPHEREQLDI